MKAVISKLSTTTNIEGEAERQKTALLYRNAGAAQWANIINASLLAYVNATLHISGRVAFIWWLVIVTLAVGRTLLARRFHAADPDAAASVQWRKRYLATTALTASAWGAGTVLFMWHGSDAALLFTGLVLSGMVAGAVSILAPVHTAYRTYSLLILIPMASVIFLQANSPLLWAFGFMTLIFMAVVLTSARFLHETLDRSISLGLQQKQLVDNIEQARNAAEESLIEQKQTEEALRESRERYRQILQHSPTGIVHYDSDLIITYCNDRFAEILHTEREKLLGLDMNRLKDQRIVPALRMALDGRTGSYEGEYVSTLTNTRIWTTISCAPLLGAQGQNEGGIAIVEDDTLRKRSEDALREKEARFRYMLETSPIAVRIAGMSGHKVLFANQRYAELIESSADTLIGVDPVSYYADPDEYREIIDLLAQGEQVTNRLVELAIPGGKIKWALASYLALEYENEPAVLGWFYDITAQKELERQMELLAQTDPLTSLANRRHFMAIAENELARTSRYGGSLSMLMLDIDHFKQVNDTHGHKTGDVVLVRLGELCHEALRNIDTVGRMGGEEFAVVLPQTGREQALEAAERLRVLIGKTEIPMEHGVPLHFTVSIGVVTLSGRSSNIDTLLNQADTALYEAKRSGRNRVCVYQA
ncbi:MAG: sensor domain-containing diguanylate cyclase [Gallionellaceae bacterium]|nr:sensor domain-containing diguanylate cyclase [Gallionellaceae bacterium]